MREAPLKASAANSALGVLLYGEAQLLFLRWDVSGGSPSVVGLISFVASVLIVGS